MDSEADLLARQLIELFAAALRDLNGGKAIPKPWREHLDKAIGPKARRGRPPIGKVRERDLNIARLVLQHRLSMEGKATTMKMTAFAQQLADQYQTKGRAFIAKDIFSIAKRYEIDAMSDEICRRLREDDEIERQAREEKATRISERLASGETLAEILADPKLPEEDFLAIRNHQLHGADLSGTPKQSGVTDYQSRRKKIMRWVSDGMSMRIYEPVPIQNLQTATRRGLVPVAKRRR